MPEKVAPGPVHDAHCIREAVCIDTKKIFDSCKEEDIASLSKLPIVKYGFNTGFLNATFKAAFCILSMFGV